MRKDVGANGVNWLELVYPVFWFGNNIYNSWFFFMLFLQPRLVSLLSHGPHRGTFLFFIPRSVATLAEITALPW